MVLKNVRAIKNTDEVSLIPHRLNFYVRFSASSLLFGVRRFTGMLPNIKEIMKLGNKVPNNIAVVGIKLYNCLCMDMGILISSIIINPM